MEGNIVSQYAARILSKNRGYSDISIVLKAAYDSQQIMNSAAMSAFLKTTLPLDLAGQLKKARRKYLDGEQLQLYKVDVYGYELERSARVDFVAYMHGEEDIGASEMWSGAFIMNE